MQDLILILKSIHLQIHYSNLNSNNVYVGLYSDDKMFFLYIILICVSYTNYKTNKLKNSCYQWYFDVMDMNILWL